MQYISMVSYIYKLISEPIHQNKGIVADILVLATTRVVANMVSYSYIIVLKTY
jgi:hypothetical protein